MSTDFQQQFKEVRDAQLQRNEARRMRTLVAMARGDIHRSGKRWPFELMQNAHDPGPRQKFTTVDIVLSFNGTSVIYEHNGRPFSMRDLAALLSGGSSKDFESSQTTGRFGTGFLLTHVLANQIDFEGVVEVNSSYEKVHLHLDRSGDEETIYRNTTTCNDAITQATSLLSPEGHPTARFTYIIDNPEAVSLGFESILQILPYLYGSCEHLGQVEIRMANGRKISFIPETSNEYADFNVQIRERLVAIFDGDNLSKTINTVRLKKHPESASGLMIVLEQLSESWKVALPPDKLPKIFCRFPIRGSDFLPVNVIIDGQFDLTQERDAILMEEKDKSQIADALELLPTFVQVAIAKGWMDGFKLAQLGMPTTFFGEPLEDGNRDWWRETLCPIANKLSNLQIVDTENGEFHKIALPIPSVHIILPRFDNNQSTDELDFETVWEVATMISDLLPPKREIARDWANISEEWRLLGVSSNRVTLSDLAILVRNGATKLDDLKTKISAFEWLSRFLNLVGQIERTRNCEKILSNLMPDQNNTLRSPIVLKRDDGIEDDLKKISADIKLDVRSRLLSSELCSCAQTPGFLYLKSLIDAQVPHILTSHNIIEECLQELSNKLPDSKQITPDKEIYRNASIDFLLFLWKTKDIKAAEIAQRCPLITLAGTAVRWSTQRKIMAPISHWPADAKPFARVYKEDRVLSEDYLTRFKGDTTLIEALVAWNIAYSEPLYTDSPKELQGERLKAIANDCPANAIDGTSLQFSQIALLPTELIQRCQFEHDLAKMLLGLVISYVAQHDKLWRDVTPLTIKNNGVVTPFSITRSLWLADLISRPWIPVLSEKGSSSVMADATTLLLVLDPLLLQNNNLAVMLLTKFFGFNELTLRLLSTAPNEVERKLLENGIAVLIQSLGSDANNYTSLAADIEMKKRLDEAKQRNRKFGIAVQEALKQCLELHNLALELIDCGYDYDVFVEDTAQIEGGTLRLQLADYLLEIKATTTGEVRLTPTQARTASEETNRFLLCVVDLRGIPKERMEEPWSVTDIMPNTKIVRGIGDLISQPHGLIAQAVKCAVGIRHDDVLRYGVPVNVWEAGISVQEWIDTISSVHPEHNVPV